MRQKIQSSLKSDKNNEYLHEDRYTYLIIPHFFLECEMFQTKAVQKPKHMLCAIIFFLSKNRAVFEIMWKNIVDRGRP